MDSRWLYIAFDWRKFNELAPRLRGFVPGRGGLESIDGAQEVLEDVMAYLEDDAPPEIIRNSILGELCTVDEGALFEAGLPELLTWLRRQPKGDAPAELLASMISASPGLEDWFRSDHGLVGILTVDETSNLARLLGAFRRSFIPPSRPRGLAAIGRHFRTSEPAIEHLEELFSIVEEAAAEMRGLAAIRVE